MSDEYTQRLQAEADFAEAERQRQRIRAEALEEAAQLGDQFIQARQGTDRESDRIAAADIADYVRAIRSIARVILLEEAERAVEQARRSPASSSLLQVAIDAIRALKEKRDE